MRKKTRRTDGISFRNFDDSWYSSVGGEYRPLRDPEGQKIKGKECEAKAKIAYAKILLMLPKDRAEAAQGNPTGDHVPLKLIFSNYLDYLEAESITTFFDNKRYLKEFLAFSEAE